MWYEQNKLITKNIIITNRGKLVLGQLQLKNRARFKYWHKTYQELRLVLQIRKISTNWGIAPLWLSNKALFPQWIIIRRVHALSRPLSLPLFLSLYVRIIWHYILYNILLKYYIYYIYYIYIIYENILTNNTFKR